jgi:hypothetical protein
VQVGRALTFFKTGKFEIDNSPTNHFSADNYGDQVVRVTVPGAHGQYKKVKEKCATAFLSTVEHFNKDRWTYIRRESTGFLPNKKKGRAVQNASGAGSDGIEFVDEEEDIVLLSDKE